MEFKYCNSIKEYSRFKTKVVHVGNIPLGGYNPIRIQSMTNTNTLDTQATADQCIRIINAGADYVRITTPTIKDAENLAEIKRMLVQRGYKNPLIADIHFSPAVAEIAAKYVEKIRINPGNFTDRNLKFEFTENEFIEELNTIRERIKPIVKICKERKTAIRIGTNHGSLSSRIVSKYGDTPRGMVESAMEFLRICAEFDFHELVVSMKSSNTLVMMQANRLLVNAMLSEGMNYPIHLGVTEAGDAEDGRIKSAAGIATMLADGIGDTIRVSLAEDPENEIPVAKNLVCYYMNPSLNFKADNECIIPYNPFQFEKRNTIKIEKIGGDNLPAVLLDISKKDMEDFSAISCYKNNEGSFIKGDCSADYIITGHHFYNEIEDCCSQILYYPAWNKIKNEAKNIYPLYHWDEFIQAENKSEKINFLALLPHQINEESIPFIQKNDTLVIILSCSNEPGFHEQRNALITLMNHKITTPIIIKRSYHETDAESFLLRSTSDVSLFFMDGMANGLLLEDEHLNNEMITQTCFNILQATRSRISKTEFIACPSCGRTLFDLQATLAEVKKTFSHLKGLKIAVMGCIVNGPGEMADADYGYVGAGPGKVNLYKGKNIIKKSIATENAIEELILILKENGDWQ